MWCNDGQCSCSCRGLGRCTASAVSRSATARCGFATMCERSLQTRRSLLHGQAYGAAGLDEEIWALKDVSFEVKHGEVVAIIGATARQEHGCQDPLGITEPPRAYADVYRRRVLLEGAPASTRINGPREHYLNGAILGMGRDEMTQVRRDCGLCEVEPFPTRRQHYSTHGATAWLCCRCAPGAGDSRLTRCWRG